MGGLPPLFILKWDRCRQAAPGTRIGTGNSGAAAGLLYVIAGFCPFYRVAATAVTAYVLVTECLSFVQFARFAPPGRFSEKSSQANCKTAIMRYDALLPRVAGTRFA